MKPGRGVPERFFQRYAKRIRGLVTATENQPPLAKPKRKAPRGEPDTPQTKELYEKLRRWRRDAAEERGVEGWVVARNELLLRVARATPSDRGQLAELLEPFRDREYGDAMLAALLA